MMKLSRQVAECACLHGGTNPRDPQHSDMALLGAHVAHPLLSHPPAPPYEDFTSPHNVDCPVPGWLFTALLPPPWRAPPGARGAAPALVPPALVEYVGTL